MAIQYHKWVLYAVDGRDNGWSFPLYRLNNSNTLEPGGITANALAAAFCKCMAKGSAFTYARESIVGVRGAAIINPFSTAAAYKGDPTQDMEQAGSCLMIECWNTTWTKRKKMYFHGVWDSAIVNGVAANPAGWGVLKDALITELKNGWGWLTVDTKTTSAVTAVAVGGADQVLLTLADPIFVGPFNGQTKVPLFIKGVDSIPKMKNPVSVTPLSANTCLTKNKFAKPVLGAGTVLFNGPIFQPIQQCVIQRATTHKLGRPFRPRAAGRRKAA